MRKRKYTTPLFLAASLILIGCSSSTIVARPEWQNDKIVDVNDIKDNTLKSIYDAIKNLGDTNANALNRVMYNIAKNQIGEYATLKAFVNLGETKAITDEAFINFVKDRKIYQSEDKGAIMTKQKEGTLQDIDYTPTEKLQISFRKVKNQLERIEEDIAEQLYNEIKGGSYNDTVTKLFDERNFVQHLKKELYKVDTTSYSEEASFKSGMPILPKKTQKEKYSDIIKEYLSFDIIIAGTSPVEKRYDDYINRKILPELYKTYLTETYVFEQRYSSLGRSYARKVNMIAVPYTEKKTETYVSNMLEYYAKNYITGDEGKTPIDANYNLDNISNAIAGFEIGAPLTLADCSEEYKILNFTNNNIISFEDKDWDKRENFPKITGDDGKPLKYHARTNKQGIEYDNCYNPTSPSVEANQYTYVYKNTKLGEMIEKLLKFCVVKYKDSTETTPVQEYFDTKGDLTEDEEKEFSDFTYNHTMLLKDAIVRREQEARATDLTKDGWFLKNGGLTDLDTEHRDRLFNITTSTTVDNYQKIYKTDSEYGIGEFVRYFGNVDTTKEEGQIDISNRRAFLTSSQQHLYQSVVLKGKSNYFIVEVQEAASTSKLGNKTGSYLKTKAFNSDRLASSDSANKIISDIVKANSSSDTYKKNANEYYLMISNIVFYDQSVYDYFKSQFPDLFK